MNVELYYFKDCPSYPPAAANLKAALRAEGLPENIKMVEVTSEEDAPQLRSLGA